MGREGKGFDFHSLRLLASGRTAEVFAAPDDRIVKLLRPRMPRRLAERERRNTAAACGLGLPTPKPGDVVQFAGRYGLVFERLYGLTMLERLMTSPDEGGPAFTSFASSTAAVTGVGDCAADNSAGADFAGADFAGVDFAGVDFPGANGADDELASIGCSPLAPEAGADAGADPMAAAAYSLADLHLRIHRCVAPNSLPSQKEMLAAAIRRGIERLRADGAGGLTDDVVVKLLARLEALPDGRRLCHGDFHPGNVVVTEQGPSVIDWLDATRGHPMADVARTSVILLETAGILEDFTGKFVPVKHSDSGSLAGESDGSPRFDSAASAADEPDRTERSAAAERVAAEPDAVRRSGATNVAAERVAAEPDAIRRSADTSAAAERVAAEPDAIRRSADASAAAEPDATWRSADASGVAEPDAVRRSGAKSAPDRLPGVEGPPPFSPEAVMTFHRMYLERRLGTDPDCWREYEKWIPIVAAARLDEVDGKTRRWLFRQILDSLGE